MDQLAAGQAEILRHLDNLYMVLILLVIGGLLSLLIVGCLAAWSVQRVTMVHKREFAMILELLAKVLSRGQSDSI